MRGQMAGQEVYMERAAEYRDKNLQTGKNVTPDVVLDNGELVQGTANELGAFVKRMAEATQGRRILAGC